MKKTLFAAFSIATITSSMFVASYYSAHDEQGENTSTNVEISASKEQPSAYVIEVVSSANSDVISTEDSPIIYEPAPKKVEKVVKKVKNNNNKTENVETTSQADSSNKNSTKESTEASSTVFSDNIAGKLTDFSHVPCGGLWEYYYDNFYAREINCAGSDNYLNISKGEKINIAGKSCTMVGAQNLNYHTDTMDKVKWLGNTIVQTCYHGNTGNVRLVNFNCG